MTLNNLKTWRWIPEDCDSTRQFSKHGQLKMIYCVKKVSIVSVYHNMCFLNSFLQTIFMFTTDSSHRVVFYDASQFCLWVHDDRRRVYWLHKKRRSLEIAIEQLQSLCVLVQEDQLTVTSYIFIHRNLNASS